MHDSITDQLSTHRDTFFAALGLIWVPLAMYAALMKNTCARH